MSIFLAFSLSFGDPDLDRFSASLMAFASPSISIVTILSPSLSPFISCQTPSPAREDPSSTLSSANISTALSSKPLDRGYLNNCPNKPSTDPSPSPRESFSAATLLRSLYASLPSVTLSTMCSERSLCAHVLSATDISYFLS